MFIAIAAPAANAQSAPSLYSQPFRPTQLVALIDKGPQATTIVIEAPYPFIEVSRILPDTFDRLHGNIGAANRLIAWYVPRGALPNLLTDKPGRSRALRVQVRKDMESVRYTPADLLKLREESIQAMPGIKPITENDVETLFAIMDLSQFNKKVSAQKVIGMTELGPDSFTICIATSAEGQDLEGGTQVEATMSCMTRVLINGKILSLTVSGPEVSAKELSNAMRLTRRWIDMLRAENTVPALGGQTVPPPLAPGVQAPTANPLPPKTRDPGTMTRDPGTVHPAPPVLSPVPLIPAPKR